MGTSAESQHLVQTLQAVGALEAVVLRSFGPHGGQVLFTKDTGQAMLSRCGARILTALHLDHPLARFIVDCASMHSANTGDGSKTFILLLASLVRGIHTTTSKDMNAPVTARRLSVELCSFALQELNDLITVGVMPYGQCISWKDLRLTTSSPVQKLLSAFFHTRLGHNNSGFISSLFCEMLTKWKSNDSLPLSTLQFLKDMFPVLYTPVVGLPISYCRLIEGQVIHRDFATPFTHKKQDSVKAIVFNGPIDPGFLDAKRILEVGGKQNILDFSSYTEKTLKTVIEHLQSLDVSILLSSVKQSAAVLSLTTQAQICVVECISQEEIALFSHLSGVTPVPEYWTIQSNLVVPLAFCRPIILGPHRYVHVGFLEKQSIKPCSLVICGAGEGQAEQHASALEDAIQMLLTTWEPLPAITSAQGCVIPAGGTYEFILSQVLKKKVPSDTDPVVFRILADSLLCVSRHIYFHNPRLLTQTQSSVLKYIKEHGAFPIHCHCNSLSESPTNPCCLQPSVCMLQSGLESVSCKYQLFLAVLQCVSRLFQIESIHYTGTKLKTARYVSHMDCEDSEDSEHEAEN